MRGIVKWFSVEKKYGFITVEGMDKDIFVHASGVEEGVLIDGQHVEFELQPAVKGSKAVNVKVAPLEEGQNGN